MKQSKRKNAIRQKLQKNKKKIAMNHSDKLIHLYIPRPSSLFFRQKYLSQCKFSHISCCDFVKVPQLRPGLTA
jgi:hypothetical protein